jgi:hypothetical protein
MSVNAMLDKKVARAMWGGRENAHLGFVLVHEAGAAPATLGGHVKCSSCNSVAHVMSFLGFVNCNMCVTSARGMWNVIYGTLIQAVWRVIGMEVGGEAVPPPHRFWSLEGGRERRRETLWGLLHARTGAHVRASGCPVRKSEAHA